MEYVTICFLMVFSITTDILAGSVTRPVRELKDSNIYAGTNFRDVLKAEFSLK